VSLTMALLLVILLALGWLAPRAGDRWFRIVEDFASRMSRRKLLTIVCVGLAMIGTRLALIPILPVPVPAIHDEFSYLLAANTFAHGRLTNPPHPMWVFFDTFHVLQHPTYASKYLPGPGAVLALGQLLGHPWIGNLLSLAAMCMAMTWMLQGWFPPGWALIGGVLVLLRIGLFNYWMDGYFVGSFAAIGGALVLGALPRIIKLHRRRDAVLMGVGAAIMACSRPVEGLIFCAPVGVTLALELLRRQKRPLAIAVRQVLWPVLLVPVAALLFLGYSNWRVTHNVFLFPYVLYHREYINYPVFVWQRAAPPLHYDNPQFEAFFNGWLRSQYKLSWIDGWRRAWLTCLGWWYIYVGPMFSIPALAFPYVLRNPRARFLLGQFLFCAIGLLSVVWFQPHYAAPLAATWFILLILAMRYLRRLQIARRPVGIFWSRLVVLLALAWIVVLVGRAARRPLLPWSVHRAQMVRQLNSLPEKHLVLVHYSASHNVHQEWVYNLAEIDAAKIVWAREIPGRDITPLLDYFKDRTVWVLQADASPPTIEPYRTRGQR
jgi:hypothetical protein